MYKKILFITAIIMSMSCHAINCNTYLLTQSQMNKCSYKSYVSSNKKLNKIYKKVLDKYKKYPAAYSASIKAEKSWIQFRDAQIKMKFPPLKKGHFYGHIHPVFKYDYLQNLTNQRIKLLKEILKDTYIDELNS
jgi:uncharacterized protein YecT (DUF1311 family)